MAGAMSNGNASIGLLEGLAADELQPYTTNNVNLLAFYTNSQTSANYYFWQAIYQNIYSCNAVIDGLNTYSGTSPGMKKQLIAEAKFTRAFLLFYAVNCYGDAPIPTGINYIVNDQLARSPKSVVYQQVIADLKDAAQNLSPVYSATRSNNTFNYRVIPVKWAAMAMLARTYLYTGDWTNAAAMADSVILCPQYSLLANHSQVFLANSNEAIFQLQPVNNISGVQDANAYLPKLTVYYGYYPISSPNTAMVAYLNQTLVNAFEPGDLRFKNWVGNYKNSSNTLYYYPSKYQQALVFPQNNNFIYPENIMVLRLAEQYLIRAEARANLGDITGAQSDLNIIRKRSGLGNTAAANQADLLTAILHERQVELFTEWGNRWFDLIRTNNCNAVMGSPGNICQSKGGQWSPNAMLLPIPQSEINLDANLAQNPGY